MKQNLSDCQKSIDFQVFFKSFFVAVILLSSFVFSLTLNEIVEKSKSDPEFAWDMYLTYISKLGNKISKEEEKEIEKVGRFLNAKRKLKDYEFALKEDLSQLVEFSKSFELPKSAQYYIAEVFGSERILNYVKENITKDISVIILLNYLPETQYVLENLSNQVIQVLLENRNSREHFLGNVFRKISSADEMAKILLNQLYMQYSESEEPTKSQLLELYKDFSLKGYKFEKLEGILSATENKLSKRAWYKKLADWLSEKVNTLRSIKFLSSFWNFFIIVFLISIVLIFILFPQLRYILLKFFGLKKQAALVYKKIVEKDPLNPDKRIRLAQLFEEAGMYEEALNEYNFLKRIKIE
ncbi:MAG: tetratricopeptide repeat protein [Fervidobacterium sp.]|uniref:tetratricopeptide repeat protein n=1 Tax=Fervidobacterium sp. TaxID=1871331 RepID=UPI00404B281A